MNKKNYIIPIVSIYHKFTLTTNICDVSKPNSDYSGSGETPIEIDDDVKRRNDEYGNIW